MNNKQIYKDDIEQKNRSTKKKVLTGLGSVAGGYIRNTKTREER